MGRARLGRAGEDRGAGGQGRGAHLPKQTEKHTQEIEDGVQGAPAGWEALEGEGGPSEKMGGMGLHRFVQRVGLMGAVAHGAEWRGAVHGVGHSDAACRVATAGPQAGPRGPAAGNRGSEGGRGRG